MKKSVFRCLYSQRRVASSATKTENPKLGYDPLWVLLNSWPAVISQLVVSSFVPVAVAQR